MATLQNMRSQDKREEDIADARPDNFHALRNPQTPEIAERGEKSDAGSTLTVDAGRSNEPNTTGHADQSAARATANDDTPFSIWTSNEKKLIILAASIASLFSPISAQIYFPAIDVIAADLNVSYTLINLTITTYMIMQGLAPAFIGGLSDDAGRRPAYFVCFVFYLAANIGLAVQNNYPALMVLRCFQSAGSSGTVALVNAVVADVVTSSERGVYISWTSVAPQLGPSVGPIIGGLLAQYAGWHFIFWFLAMLAGVVFVPMALLLPETCRQIVGDGSIPPVTWNRCLTNTRHERKAVQAGQTIPWEKRDELARSRHLHFPNPFSTLRILLRKECGYALLYNGLVCSGFYAVTALIPSQFGAIYGFNELQISLCYIPLGIGCMLAAFVRGRFIDLRFKHHARKLGMPVVRNRRTDLANFPIERARIEVAIPTLFVGAAALIGFGWMVQYRVNLAGPLIMIFVMCFCISASLNCIAVLIIDINPTQAGTATAAYNLTRCWLGAGSTALVVPMIDAVGVGWTCSFFGLLVVGFSPVLWYIMNQGPKWRRESRERAELKKAEREVGANVGREKGLTDKEAA